MVRALYRGPAHVIVDASPKFLALTGDVLGKPAREAFAEPEYAPAQRAMDRVFETGIPEAMLIDGFDGIPGVIVYAPLIEPESRQVVGLQSLWRPLPVPLGTARPASRRQGPGLVLLAGRRDA